MRTIAAILAPLVLFGAAPATAGPAQSADAVTLRAQLLVVGATSMAPLVDTLVPGLVRKTGMAPPEVRLGGSVEGMKAFCAGVGVDHPDIALATRRMTKTEFDRCQQTGVLDIIELEIGHGALLAVVKTGDPVFDLSARVAYLGLAAQTPAPESGEDFQANPFARWHQIHPRLPDLAIQVFGPSPASGSRAVVETMLMENGCRGIPAIGRIFSAERRFRQCTRMRADGAYVDVPEPFATNAIERMLAAPPGAIAITSYAGYRRYAGRVTALPVAGVAPSPEEFQNNGYPWVTSYYAYFKRGHMRDKFGRGVARGLREFMEEILGDAAAGPNGYLGRAGFVPLDPQDRLDQLARARRLERFTR